MKIVLRLVALAGLIALAIWLYTVFFPSAEKQVRTHLLATAVAAGFPAHEGELARAANLAAFIGCFADPVELKVSLPYGERAQELGRDELLQAGNYARNQLGSLKVQFLDITITVAPDKENASADLTVRGSTPGDANYLVQEMKFDLRKIKGRWLINRVETIRVLN
ncbi:MAG: hypothetical protein EPO07_18325 [Verrucomicrobia bacterium]|nr:MAG: hypothetical protein EPO07_18325 [Verrucomicrobiota bacterium]